MREASERAIAAVHEELVRVGLVEPVALEGPDERLFLDCDLASFAENRLGDRTDPRTVDDARRLDWQARATTYRARSLRARAEYDRCYWLKDGAARVGTIALATGAWGSRSIRMSSFYVFPDLRGQGHGRRALAGLEAALGAQKLSLRFDTNWSWQHTVRFYLSAGMWLYMWKRELDFFWSKETPPPILRIGADEASLSVLRGEEEVVLQRARRRGDALELLDHDRDLEKDKRLGDLYWLARTTFSLALALEGWPLIRSPEDWESSHYADAGPPEALAHKITLWEAWDRNHGWVVDTPRIPGLEYPSWADFEARWAAYELEAGLVPKEP